MRAANDRRMAMTMTMRDTCLCALIAWFGVAPAILFAQGAPPLVVAQSPNRQITESQNDASSSVAPTDLRLPPHITLGTRDAIERGLAYLARTQDRQGSWSNRGNYGAYPVAMTALAGLALLMDGNTTTQGRYAPQVDRAADFILRSVAPNGLIAGGREEARPMYGHGFSVLFLSQLYGMTEDAIRARQIRDVLDRAVTLTGRGQSELGGWIYTPDGNSDEGSVTITQVQALRSCRSAGITVPKEIIDRAMKYLADSQNSDGGIRYSLRQRGGGSRAPITGAAVLCWYLAGEYTNPLAKRALDYTKDKVKPNATNTGHDYYAHFYFSQALYVSSDPYWDEYFPKRRDYLLSQQQPEGYWSGDGVGDIYGTAVALVILQLPYNQLPIMQR
ncbi:MAG: terpene cyclase/mutase family protein [Phycisphaerales bacterium]|nr:terpene cyclase/mutase family protein [Phycisphaerales bacterium]